MILQLNPPIPVSCPKGTGLAHAIIDYGAEHHLLWQIFIDSTGESWVLDNTLVRAQKNISMGRTFDNKAPQNKLNAVFSLAQEDHR